MTPQETVDAFIAAIERKDVDAAMEMAAEGISYENMPMDPIGGREGVAATVRGFLEPASAVEWRVVRQWGFEQVVVNERLDRFQIGTGWLELPTAGVFEVGDDGLITLWRDYFDLGSYMSQLAALTAA